MKHCRSRLGVVGAMVLLGAFASAGSAGRLSLSANTVNAVWARLIFSGGIGDVECEVILTKTLHARTMDKVRLRLMGYVTAANVTRCARGGVTVLRETAPWHVRYHSFGGTLPNISGIRTLVVGLPFRIREPTFGIECLARSTPEEPMVLQYNLDAGRQITTATVGGTVRCGGFTETFSGTSSTISEAGGARVTVTLI